MNQNNSSHNDAILTRCRRIFLRNYTTKVHIGVYENEKQTQQLMRFNIDIYVLLSDCTPSNDQLDEVLDYDIMQQTITQCTQAKHINLQETICDDIARKLLQQEKIQAVRVTTEKLDVYKNCESVGVEVFLRRAQIHAS